MHKLTLDGSTFTIDYPDYDDEDMVSGTTMLFMAIADRLIHDEEWVESMIAHAEEMPMYTKH